MPNEQPEIVVSADQLRRAAEQLMECVGWDGLNDRAPIREFEHVMAECLQAAGL